MKDQIADSIERLRKERVTRRDLFRSLVGITGGLAAAPLLFEAIGHAQTASSGSASGDSNLSTETIKIPAGRVQIEAYLAKPKEEGKKFPPVIVVHDSRGLTEHFRDVTRRFAAEGYLAIAPDLLSRAGGTSAVKPDEMSDTLNAIAPMTTLGDLLVTMNIMQRRPDVDADKVATVGFGWGGWRSFMMATQDSDLKRVVVFYGAAPEYGLEKIDASVLGHYAKWDNRVTGNALLISEKMKAAGKKYQYYVYDKTDRGFFDNTGPNYNADAAKLAWQRTIDFLRS
jgi:carboxymethylenebutenolidase